MSEHDDMEFKTCLDAAQSFNDWTNCSTADCPNKVCYRFKNGKCWPCTMGIPVNWAQGMTTKLRELVSQQTEDEYWRNRS